MVKSYLNLVFFIIIVTIFLFFLCSPNIHGFRTPMPNQPNRNNRVFSVPGQPVYVTPSNVRIIRSDSTPPRFNNIEEPSKSGFFVGRDSPTDSVAASTVFGVPTEFPVTRIPTTSRFSEEIKVVSKKKESVGERICHRIFHKFVASKLGYEKDLMRNIRPNFLKNPKTGHNLELDIFEPFDNKITDKNQIIDGIAVEYNGQQHDQYIPGMHEDLEAFDEQKFRDGHKAKVCKNKGIILIIIDTKIDVSRIRNTNGGRKKFINFTESERESTIEAVLWPQLEDAYRQLMLNRCR